ncbi:trifunctional histidinol dehydrogenase, partial [Elasticomyces elasticus]
MAAPLLVSYNPSPSGLSIDQIAFLGRVLLKVESLAEADAFLRENFRRLDVYLDATAIASPGDVVDLLNVGAAKVFISLPQVIALSQEQSVPSDRLVVYVSSASDIDSFQKWVVENPERKLAGLCTTESCPATKALADKLGMNLEAQNLYQSFTDATATTTEDAVKQTLNEGVVGVVPAQNLTFDRTPRDGQVSAASLVAARAVADQSNGLYATIVTDERGVSLGLVWSSDESIAEAFRTGTGVYQSRKRGLWYKGQSSGDVQELLRVGFDCDSDCLVFVVNQIGRGFCHLGRASCFGPYNGLSRLQKTLQERKADAPAGSYTARLFNDPKLAQAKIMEEADELCRANSKEEIAFEAADLLYFALTRCVASGVSLDDVERNLDLKSLKVKRRKGDAKGPWAEKAGL